MNHAPSEVAASARPLIHAFKELSIACYVGGSLATTAHGAPRSTIDADVVADIHPSHIDPLLSLIEPVYIVSREIISTAIHKRDSFNVIHRELLIKTDVFVLRHYLYERQTIDRIEHLPIDRAHPEDLFPFCSAEDIILHKLMWYDQGGRVSERQWTDLLTVMKVQADALDRAYLEKWSDYLGVTGLLLDAFKQAGLQQ